MSPVTTTGSNCQNRARLNIEAMLRKQLGLFAESDDDGTNDGVRVTAQGGAGAASGGGGGARGAAGGPGALHNAALFRWRQPSPFEELVDVFATLVCAAQECVRALGGGERSVASLRDVARCVKVYRWFGEHLHANEAQEPPAATLSRAAQRNAAAAAWDMDDFFAVRPCAHDAIRRATVLALAYCYRARLPRDERRELVGAVTEAWRQLQLAAQQPGGWRTFEPYRARCRWLKARRMFLFVFAQRDAPYHGGRAKV